MKTNKGFDYKILPELSLIIETFSGNIDIQDVIALNEREIRDKKYKPDFNFIINIQELTINTNELASSELEIEKFIEFAVNNALFKNYKKTAVLTSNPNNVVIGTFFINQCANYPIDIKLFNTLESVVKWLGLTDIMTKYVRTKFERMNALSPSLYN